MGNAKITKQVVDAMSQSLDQEYLWDTSLRGFGVRAAKNGDKTYVVQYRTAGGRSGTARRVKIGKHGSPWTAETARAEAKRILSEVGLGADPALLKHQAKAALTVSDLCDLYLTNGIGAKKPSTLATDRGRIERHIKPLLGKRRINQLTPAHVRDFLQRVARGETAADVKTKPRGRAIVTGGTGTASRTMGLLGGICSFAVDAGLLAVNPVHGVKPFPDHKNERFLATPDIEKLGSVLRAMATEGYNSKALIIVELLLLTGARRGEIEHLKWSEVDLLANRINLADSKTGRKSLPLNSAAVALLATLRGQAADDATFAFPASRGSGHFAGTPKVWRALRKRLGEPSLRLHDLRHSFASLGVLQGAPLLMVGKLLGHANQSTTQRYAHLADDPVRAATEQIGQAVVQALGD